MKLKKKRRPKAPKNSSEKLSKARNFRKNQTTTVLLIFRGENTAEKFIILTAYSKPGS